MPNQSSIKKGYIISPMYGEISTRRAVDVMRDEKLQMGLRAAYNVLITRNGEVALRPPTNDQGPLNASGATARSFAFRTPTGDYTVATFSASQVVIDRPDQTFTPQTIVTTWDSGDVAAMDTAFHEQVLFCVTPAKEPRFLVESAGTYTWVTVQSVKGGTNDPPWHSTSDWPRSCGYMLSRFIAISKRNYYGSQVKTADGAAWDWDLKTTTVDGDTVVTPSSAFSYNAADDSDSGFNWIRGGTMAFGGSPNGVWMLSNYEDGLNAMNPNMKNYNTEGTFNVPPVDALGGFVYFAADGKTLKFFAVTPNGPVNPELNPYSKHLFEEYKPVRMVFQSIPDTIVWILREDGVLIAFAADEVRRAPSRIVTDGVIKDVWICKDNDGETLWLDVERGNDRRYETIDTLDPVYDEFFADGIVATNASAAQEVTAVADDGSGGGEFTIAAHGWSGGELVRLIDLDGYDWGYVVLVDSNTVSVQLPNLSLVPSTVSSGFSIRDAYDEITVPHMANATVDVSYDDFFAELEADGTGKITLPSPGSDVYVGYQYEGWIEPPSLMNIIGFYKGTVNKISPMLYRSRTIRYGNTTLKEKHLSGDSDYSGVVPYLPIDGGLEYDPSFRVGGRRAAWIMIACEYEIEIGVK
jgi:hypothetical protein